MGIEGSACARNSTMSKSTLVPLQQLRSLPATSTIRYLLHAFHSFPLYALHIGLVLQVRAYTEKSYSSRMHVMNNNWSAIKQRLHPQSVAKISRHLVLSGDRIRQCRTSSGSRHKDTDQCL